MYEDRVRKIRRLMEDKAIDIIMVTSEPNMLYFSGYSAISLERLITLIIRKDEDRVLLIVPKLEEKRVEEKCRLRDFELVSYSDTESPINILENIFSRSRKLKIGIEETIQFKYVYPLISKLTNIEYSLIDDLIYSMRKIKELEEVDILKKAAEKNNQVLLDAIKNVRAGIREKELMMHIKNYALELGAEEVPFALVQSGSNSALPHQEPTNKIIDKGDIVVLDIGVRYQGYYSDLTRTIVCGTPSSKQLEIFNIVLRAQQAALDIIRENIKAEEVDIAARRTIEAQGYGEYFIHRTGHGLGLEVHEPPFIKTGNTELLKNGMVFTVEPGIYLPNLFGVRLEDNIVVSKMGYINLATLPKSLYIEDYT
ncbi:MAG: Xaa-Pro peptidase family protein [Aigarchaeota archaeon]|nr:Xaa-Pro peptidase family protein [Candidatus Pelearchaeum maunauluense]